LYETGTRQVRDRYETGTRQVLATYEPRGGLGSKYHLGLWKWGEDSLGSGVEVLASMEDA
jgi:hypothetical protein